MKNPLEMSAAPEKSPEANVEYKVVDGRKYRKIDSGYTIRQYYSHSTPGKGFGPGWDTRTEAMVKYGLKPFDSPSLLPDEPLYLWEEVEEDK